MAELAQVALRGSSARFLDACEAALGLRPPTLPNTVASDGQRSVLWLGPDEWLVVDAAESQGEIVSRLRSALQGIHSAVVDVSASRKVLGLSGSHAQDVLTKAATLDFSLESFPVGSCAQTNIARTRGLIERRGQQEFLIYVGASFARYLAAWLEDAKQQ